MSNLNENDTFELVYQIVAGARRHKHDTNTLRTVLTEINRVTNNWEPVTVPVDDATKVMFALDSDTSEWASAGIDINEVPSWEAIGFTATYTNKWCKANLSLAHALKWSTLRNLTSLDPNEISKWEHSGTYADPQTVNMWFRTSISTERAIEWTLAGGSIHSGRDWLSAYPDVNATQLHQTETVGFSLADARSWIDRNILGDDIEAFLNKGYTPAAARKHLDGGGTMAAIPDRKGSSLVVGRSWKKIADVIANDSNITAVATTKNNHIEVTLTHKNDPHPIHITFNKNGRFDTSQTTTKITYTTLGGRKHTADRHTIMKFNTLVDYISNWN